jgi:hypothetical protein
MRHDLRFDLRIGACVIKRLPCRGVSHANKGTESQVITQVESQVMTQVDTALESESIAKGLGRHI